jgi:hypothetical protein
MLTLIVSPSVIETTVAGSASGGVGSGSPEVGAVMTVSGDGGVGEVTLCDAEVLGTGVAAVSDVGEELAHAATMNAVVRASTGRSGCVGIAVDDAGSIRR